MADNALAKLDKARQMLAECTDLSEVKKIRDVAEAAKTYARAMKMGKDAQNYAAEISISASRKAGEILKSLRKSKGGEPTKRKNSTPATLAGVESEYSKALTDSGTPERTAQRWQKLAEIPDRQFTDYVEETRKQDGDITAAGLLKQAKIQGDKEQSAVRQNESRHGDSAQKLQDLVNARFKFGTIYVDPPWPYQNQGTRSNTEGAYKGKMTMEDIENLPVSTLAADASHLHLWTTNAFLAEALFLIKKWGFEYKSCFVWVKPQMGIGNYWRVSHEFLLLGVRGDAKRFANHSLKSWVEISRTKHSAKPEEVRKMIESASPGPYLELFRRGAKIPNWTIWGDEAEE